MRKVIMVLALFMVIGAPVFMPSLLMNSAIAQTATLPAAEQASVDAAIDAVLADNTLTTDQITTQIASIVQGSSNPGAASTRVTARVTATPGLSTAAIQATGAGMMQVVTNLQSTNPQVASEIQVAVAMSSSADLQIGYVNGPTTTQTPQTPQTPQTTQTTQTTPTTPTTPQQQQAGGAVTTRDPVTGVGIVVPVENSNQINLNPNGTVRSITLPTILTSNPVVPVIPEPNPVQAGSPT